jgi:hypothetical protein
VQPRIEWSIRQAINGRAIDQQIEGMHFGIGLTRDVAIKVRLRYAALVKLLHTFAGLLAKLVDRAEVDGLGWTCLGAGRLQTVALAIIAERAFVRMTAQLAARDDAERAGRDAARATVADVSLNINVLEFILNNCAGGASLVTRGRQECLQWSLIMSQRLRGDSSDTVPWEASWLGDSMENCSMNFTWRQVVADNSLVLS